MVLCELHLTDTLVWIEHSGSFSSRRNAGETTFYFFFSAPQFNQHDAAKHKDALAEPWDNAHTAADLIFELCKLMIFAKYLYSESGNMRVAIDQRLMKKVLLTLMNQQAQLMMDSIPEEHIANIIANPHIEEYTGKQLLRYNDTQDLSIQQKGFLYRAVDLKAVHNVELRARGFVDEAFDQATYCKYSEKQTILRTEADDQEARHAQCGIASLAGASVEDSTVVPSSHGHIRSPRHPHG